MHRLSHYLLAAIALGCAGEQRGRATAQADTTSDSVAKTITWELSPPMRRALDQYASGLVPYSLDQYSSRMMQYFRARDADPNDPLNQAAGDFNGDGIRDLALYGHDETRELIVVLLSQPHGDYKAISLREWKLTPDNRKGQAFLGVAPAGPLDLPEGLEEVESVPLPKTLAHDGIDIGYDGSGELFYWDGTRFVSVTTGD